MPTEAPIPARELELLRFLDDLEAHLRQVRESRKALAYALRLTREFFRAEAACVALSRPGRVEAELLIEFPSRGRWDRAFLAAFVRGRHVAIPPEMILAPIQRRGRPWGALALVRRTPPFEKGTWRWLHRATFLVSERLAQIDRDRMVEVRDRLDRKIMEQLRPKDLFYQILDGLRTLTRYDHSSALLFREDDDAAFTLVAEQIAWTKGKSRRIGMKLVPGEEVERVLHRGDVYGFDRDGDAWREWDGRPVSDLAALLDYNGGPAAVRAGGPGVDPSGVADAREAAMLVAPILSRGGVFGVLKIAARHAGSFGRYELDLVERFRSQASIAILNSRRTEFLHTRMVEAEKKNAMADLARGVAHDVNNALGAAVPIIQQMREDVRSGSIDPAVFAEDLAIVENAVLTGRRIFGGMLAFARSGHRRSGEADLRAAVDSALGILKDGLERRGISLSTDIPASLPLLAGGQSDVEQVLLNLITNARDAMSAGGRLTITARRQDGLVEVVVEDTGEGIPAELIARVQEPFFTTKGQGSGLGLSIVRSILWEMNGRMALESEPGKGTRVRFLVPVVETGVPRAGRDRDGETPSSPATPGSGGAPDTPQEASR
jgi:two-component system NtrC family sensor kinase